MPGQDSGGWFGQIWIDDRWLAKLAVFAKDRRFLHLNGPVGGQKAPGDFGFLANESVEHGPRGAQIRVAAAMRAVAGLQGENIAAHIVVERLQPGCVSSSYLRLLKARLTTDQSFAGVDAVALLRGNVPKLRVGDVGWALCQRHVHTASCTWHRLTQDVSPFVLQSPPVSHVFGKAKIQDDAVLDRVSRSVEAIDYGEAAPLVKCLGSL